MACTHRLRAFPILALLLVTVGGCVDAELVTPATAELLIDGEWSPVPLPHHLEGEARLRGGVHHYRLRLYDPGGRAGDSALGIIVLADMHAVVRLDGVELPGVGTGPMPHNWNRPLLFDAPRSGRARERLLEIDLVAPAGGHGALRMVHFGPWSAAEATHRHLHGLLIDSGRVSTAVAFGLMLFALAIGLARRRDMLYLELAGVAGCFFVHSFNLHIVERPLPYRYWNWAISTAIDAFIIGMALFSRRLTGRVVGRERRLLGAYLAVVALSPLLVPERRRCDVQDVAHMLSVGVGIWALVSIIRYRRALSPIARPILLLTGLAFVLIGTHDVLGLLGLWHGLGAPQVYMAAALLVVSCFAVLIGDMLRALRLEENINSELKRRVDEKAHQLAAVHARVLSLERERTLVEERERLSRELHDGTAGHLSTVLAMLRNGGADTGHVTRVVQSAMDDLRSIIQALDPTVEDLGDLLAGLRHDLEARARHAGAVLHWCVEGLPTGRPRAGVLHAVQRILQEATSNAARHAGATAIAIRARARKAGDATWIDLCVCDDGAGIPADARAGARMDGQRGLGNMHARAAKIGAVLRIHSGAGTRVVLSVPAPGGQPCGHGRNWRRRSPPTGSDASKGLRLPREDPEPVALPQAQPNQT